MGEHIEVLRRVPIFSELLDSELQRLSSIMTERVYGKKEFIFMEGEKRQAIYFICSGTIKTFKVNEKGNEQIINILQSGEMFPHVGFFDEGPYPATAEVIKEAELLSLRLDDFNALLMEYPAIAIKVMRIMGQKIVLLSQRIQELISEDVRHRIIHTLIRLNDEAGKVESGQVTLEIPMTNQDFANLVGTSRETINRILNDLKKQNLIDFDRQKIVIWDIERLRQCV
ncbi:cAMP-binding protein [Pullulanibacillus camelliae]|uniref:cAMP-binding protein n=1 Tax=Pullulanibacillus camelliae TaxID=1707096 RepID=A0A8J3E077_9BACL|nr:Crp/Fnr family transcriptional regulator [Pullulanibacillus camelliae]GGE50442.1 cAMP-binding protein [Pullulanibacillus camelliae]